MHTPGPWIINQQRKKVFIQGRHDTYFSIAQVGGPANKDINSINEKIGNINLIKAAPELLDALKSIPMACMHNEKDHIESCWVCKVTQAINKAEGRI